jgi:hypothetical protein
MKREHISVHINRRDELVTSGSIQRGNLNLGLPVLPAALAVTITNLLPASSIYP